MASNYIIMFLSTRTMVYIPQFVYYLEIVEAAMFYYYVSEFLHEILPIYFWYVFLK